MEVNTYSSVSSNIAATYSKTTNKDSSTKETVEVSASKTSTTASQFSDVAATYEKSTEDTVTAKTTTDRSAIVKQLQADTEKLKNNLLDIVRKTISGQGNAFAIASETDLWRVLASGNFTADPETIAQAKADIAEDGYWGVDQTSSRIVDFAIALSGNDTSKADMLLEAFKKGFDMATSTWGQKLPDISQDTYKAVEEKFEAWKNGTYATNEG